MGPFILLLLGFMGPFILPWTLAVLLIPFISLLFMPLLFIFWPPLEWFLLILGPGRPLRIFPFMLLFNLFWMPAPIGPIAGPMRAFSSCSPMPSTSGHERSSNQHICRKISSQRTISSLPSRAVVIFASSSTSVLVASTNLLKAGEVQFGIKAWWSATMCGSLEVVESELLKDEAYCQAER